MTDEGGRKKGLLLSEKSIQKSIRGSAGENAKADAQACKRD